MSEMTQHISHFYAFGDVYTYLIVFALSREAMVV
jgi:hypothetical protein